MHEWIVCDGYAVFQSPFMMKTMRKGDHENHLLHAPFFVIQKQKRSNAASATFFLVLLSVCLKRGGLLMDVICVLFLLCSPVRSSFVSVVFDFNASLNDAVPAYPMSFPVENGKRVDC